jgi:hypothetical protein
MIDPDRLGVTYFGHPTIAEQCPELATFVKSTRDVCGPRTRARSLRTTRRQHAAHG